MTTGDKRHSLIIPGSGLMLSSRPYETRRTAIYTHKISNPDEDSGRATPVRGGGARNNNRRDCEHNNATSALYATRLAYAASRHTPVSASTRRTAPSGTAAGRAPAVCLGDRQNCPTCSPTSSVTTSRPGRRSRSSRHCRGVIGYVRFSFAMAFTLGTLLNH